MNLTNENYYTAPANKQYMSVSQYKSFMDCEARAMAEINGTWKQSKTTALLVGSYVDSYFEGTLEKFREENSEIFSIKISEFENTANMLPQEYLTKNGTVKKKKLSEAKLSFPDAFIKTYTLKSDYIQAESIIKRIESDKLFMEYMSGQKQVIKTADLFGCTWKIKMDSYLPGDKIVDLKVMRSMERVMGKSFVEYWGYDLQMAVYSALEGNNLETYLAVATKQDVPDLEIIHIPDWHREECLKDISKHMPRILAVKNGDLEPERCGVCEYCRSTKVLTEPIDFELVGFSTKEIKGMKGEV